MSYKETHLDAKVYVGELGYGSPKQELEDSFSRYGRLKSVWVARNPPGFAFIEFEDPHDAEDAVKALDGTKINGRRVRVEMSSGKSRWKEGRPPRRGGRGGSGGWSGRDSRDSYDGGRRRSNRSRSRSRSPLPNKRRSRSRSRSRSSSRDRSRGRDDDRHHSSRR